MSTGECIIIMSIPKFRKQLLEIKYGCAHCCGAGKNAAAVLEEE